MKIRLNRRWRIGGWTLLAQILGGAAGTSVAANGGAQATSGGFGALLQDAGSKGNLAGDLQQLNQVGPAPMPSQQSSDWLRLLMGS